MQIWYSRARWIVSLWLVRFIYVSIHESWIPSRFMFSRTWIVNRLEISIHSKCHESIHETAHATCCMKHIAWVYVCAGKERCVERRFAYMWPQVHIHNTHPNPNLFFRWKILVFSIFLENIVSDLHCMIDMMIKFYSISFIALCFFFSLLNIKTE